MQWSREKTAKRKISATHHAKNVANVCSVMKSSQSRNALRSRSLWLWSVIVFIWLSGSFKWRAFKIIIFHLDAQMSAESVLEKSPKKYQAACLPVQWFVDDIVSDDITVSRHVSDDAHEDQLRAWNWAGNVRNWRHHQTTHSSREVWLSSRQKRTAVPIFLFKLVSFLFWALRSTSWLNYEMSVLWKVACNYYDVKKDIDGDSLDTALYSVQQDKGVSSCLARLATASFSREIQRAKLHFLVSFVYDIFDRLINVSNQRKDQKKKTLFDLLYLRKRCRFYFWQNLYGTLESGILVRCI